MVSYSGVNLVAGTPPHLHHHTTQSVRMKAGEGDDLHGCGGEQGIRGVSRPESSLSLC